MNEQDYKEKKAEEYTKQIVTGLNVRIKKLHKDMNLILNQKPSPFLDTDELYELVQLYKEIDDYVIDVLLI